MKLLPWGTLILFLAITTLTAGCTKGARPEVNINTNSNQDIIQTKAVDTSYAGLKRVIASNILIGRISVVNPKLGNAGNFARAQVTVQNLTQNRYELEYQYQWEDMNGFTAGDPRPWKRFVLAPKEVKNFPEMSLRQEANQAIFTVRLVDDTFIELNKQAQEK